MKPIPSQQRAHKQHQLPEPTVVAAISLVARADAWGPLTTTLKRYAKILFRDNGLGPGESPLDRVHDAISSILPPEPTRGHEKRRKAGCRHGEPNPITETPPIVGPMGRHLTAALQNRIASLQSELKLVSGKLRRRAIESQIVALQDALNSGTIHRLCERLRGIIRSDRFKGNDNVMSAALSVAKSFSISCGDDDATSSSALTGSEMESLSPDQPDEIVRARELGRKILALCEGDPFLHVLVEYKLSNSTGEKPSATTVDEIASAPHGPFADKRWSSLTLNQRKAKIYKANEKLVAIRRRLEKEGEVNK